MNLENEKEFENLFKRAAESYPLKTDGLDWNAVLSKLEESESKKAFYYAKKYWLFLLLIIAVGLMSVILTLYFKNNQINKANEKNALFIQQKIDTLQLNEKKITDHVYKKVVDSFIKMKEPQQQSSIADSKISISKKTVQSPPRIVLANSTNASNSLSSNSTASNSTTTNQTTSHAKNNAEQHNVTVVDSSINQTTIHMPVVRLTDSVNQINSQPSQTSTTNFKPIIQKQPLKNQYFYTGVLYAVDKSSIGFEPSRGSGHSLAFLLGYRINKRFSIESGFHFEKKEYYTTGENFDKSILPSTGKILWIESENELVEIPVSLKVDVYSKKNHELFGSVGFSSYLVNKQSFEYEEEVNGSIQSEYVVFTKNSSNLFSSINFSLGYQLKIKRLGKLRIEPYLNLPLSGIGKGKEPILSKGIYFGWIYEFHNTKLKK